MDENEIFIHGFMDSSMDKWMSYLEREAKGPSVCSLSRWLSSFGLHPRKGKKLGLAQLAHRQVPLIPLHLVPAPAPSPQSQEKLGRGSQTSNY